MTLIPIVSKSRFFFGGDEESRTPVRKPQTMAFSERSRCFPIPLRRLYACKILRSVASCCGLPVKAFRGLFPASLAPCIHPAGMVKRTSQLTLRERILRCSRLFFCQLLSQFWQLRLAYHAPNVLVETVTSPGLVHVIIAFPPGRVQAFCLWRNARSISRLSSFCLSASRLSYSFLPRPTPICILA